MGPADVPLRGEVWSADLEPTRGDEIRKTRPVVVLSVDTIGRLQLRIVAPITEWSARFRSYSWMVRLDPDPQSGLTKSSAADAFQVRSLATERLIQRLGNLPTSTVDDIADAVALCVGCHLRG
jgi:mRNA interferase MazF